MSFEAWEELPSYLIKSGKATTWNPIKNYKYSQANCVRFHEKGQQRFKSQECWLLDLYWYKIRR